MKRIHDDDMADEVEFESDEERRAAVFFDTIRDNGVNTERAVEMVRSCPPFVNLSDDFYKWLGE
jgi:hypothetical protein